MTQNDNNFENKVFLVGKVVKKDEFVNYVPFPVFGLELEVPIDQNKSSQYKFNVPEGDDPTDVFSFRVVFINKENVFNEVNVGDSISIKGELQSRNFYQKHPMTDDLLQSSVDTYQNIFQKLPTTKEPTQHMRYPIVWKSLIEMQLLDEIPTDSYYDEENKAVEAENRPYMYKIDWNGEVTKETEESILEVVAFEYSFVESAPSVNNSSVLIKGRISSEPLFDIEENGNIYAQFKLQSYQETFAPKERRYIFSTVKIMGIDAQNVLNDFKRNDYVTVVGTLVSEQVTEILRIKKITASNKTKKKKVTIKKTRRFVLSTVDYLKKQ